MKESVSVSGEFEAEASRFDESEMARYQRLVECRSRLVKKSKEKVL